MFRIKPCSLFFCSKVLKYRYPISPLIGPLLIASRFQEKDTLL